MGGPKGGESAGVWRSREFFPIALRGRAGAAPRSNLLILLNFSDWSIGIPSLSTRDALGWAGKFGKLCRIVEENNFEFWD